MRTEQKKTIAAMLDDGDDTTRPRPFTPSRQQLAYLSAWLDPKAPKTIRGIAVHHGLSRRSIYRWLEDDQFVSWFDAELRRYTDGLWAPVLLRVTELALAGSVEHAKLLAQIRDAIRQPNGGQSGRVTVIVGVPRPMSIDNPNATPRLDA